MVYVGVRCDVMVWDVLECFWGNMLVCVGVWWFGFVRLYFVDSCWFGLLGCVVLRCVVLYGGVLV